MTRRLLDLYCCEGGASMGYHRAGFQVYGVDRFRYRDQDGKLKGYRRQRYPFPAHKGDVLEAMADLLAGRRVMFVHPDTATEYLALGDFDAIAASPPCQAYSITKHTHDKVHPDLVGPTRALLEATGKPYIIENVVGAPLHNPLMLCGSEFDLTATDLDGRRLRLERHRLFESNVWLLGNGGCRHDPNVQVGGAYGGGNVSLAAAAIRRGGYTPPTSVRAALLGIDWMTQGGLSQSIPPAYTEHLGRQLMEHLDAQ